MSTVQHLQHDVFYGFFWRGQLCNCFGMNSPVRMSTLTPKLSWNGNNPPLPLPPPHIQTLSSIKSINCSVHSLERGSNSTPQLPFYNGVQLVECYIVVHQVAMLLHKLRPQKNPYYFWAVMSIVMQACACVCFTAYVRKRCKIIRKLIIMYEIYCIYCSSD